MTVASKPRPRWAADLWWWLTDGQYDHLPDNAADWRWTWREHLARPALWTLCKLYGHKPIPDQCGIPEHDFCAFCNTATPCQVPR